MAEQFVQAFSVGAKNSESITTFERTARHRAELGASALAGFSVLGEVQGAWSKLRQVLDTRIVDQQPAIDAIVEAMDISAARLSDDPRPVANFAFLGPTGVGKSETAKVLADAIRGEGGNLIKIDCSNFSNGHEVANLTGSPKGYIGSEDTPVLSKERVEPYGTVVLFDEVEKGSKELYNLMLQIMGDGKLSLSNGDTAMFKNAVVILTSNLGAQEMANSLNPTRLGFASANATADKSHIETVATKAFEDFFKPEFINRLDRTIVFHPLSDEALGRVLDTKIETLNREYQDMHGARLSISDATRSHLVDVALEKSHMGARPLIRAFEQQVQSTFGRYLGVNAIPEGTHVKVFHPSEVGENTGSQSFVFASQQDASLRKTVSRSPAVVQKVVQKQETTRQEVDAEKNEDGDESGED